MQLKGKIKNHYFQMLLDGKKQCDFRELESMVFESDDGRTATFEITEVDSPDELTKSEIYRRYPDVPWTKGLLVRIWLGKQIK